MQLAVTDKPSVGDGDVSTEMDIVEIDQGHVEMTNVEDSQTKPARLGKKGATKKVAIEEIDLDSDSEEEEVAVVGADHL